MDNDSTTINDRASANTVESKTTTNDRASDDIVELKIVYTVADIHSLKAELLQPNIDDVTLLEVVCGFPKISPVEHNPPVNEVLLRGVLPVSMQML